MSDTPLRKGCFFPLEAMTGLLSAMEDLKPISRKNTVLPASVDVYDILFSSI